MISKVNFTGREGMLTKIPSKEIERYDYLSDGRIFSKGEAKKVKEQLKIQKDANVPSWTNPFAPIKEKTSAPADFVSETMPHGLNVIG